MVWVTLKARVVDPLHTRVRIQEAGNSKPVRVVSLHPQRQGFEASLQQVGIMR